MVLDTGERTRGLAALRETLLRGSLTLMAVAMPVLAGVIFTQIALRGSTSGLTIALSAFALVFPVLRLLLPRLAFRTAAPAFLFLLMFAAFAVQIRGGFTAGSMGVYLVLIVLSGVFFGRAGAARALLLALASSGVAAWLVLRGEVPPIDTALWSPLRGEAWIRGAVSLVLFGASAAIAVVYAVQRLELEAREVLGALERERRERAAREAAEADRERTRATMEAAQRLESVGRLAGGVAHDFNNLLTIILSSAEVLRDGLSRGEVIRGEDVEEIQEAATRASDLTRRLLAFARKQVITPVPLDLNVALSATERLLRRALGEDVDLRVGLASELWTTLCDQSQFEQVVMNLAINARDAMPGGGLMVLQTRNVRAGEVQLAQDPEASGKEWVSLVVRDTGVGMSPEVRAHLFEPFFTTKSPGKGTGLGLATVYGIVRQIGGHILVESEPGRGTKFEVLLPRWSGAPQERASADVPPTARGTETILIVEDDSAVREVTHRALSAGGYTVLVAGNGPEALVALDGAECVPHLVVTDVVMPGMNGRELVENIRRRYSGVRVLFVSGYAHDVMENHGLLDDGAAFLPKPFTPSALLAKVRATLDLPDSAV